ncbi:hypothetical protein [Stigmatella aurantiaca]|uniref:Lipoprotein n=1 Tax=Stigmatella aurantiaca (strain DW4/3-1) TaxID=378806 RepID=Q08TN1_STIAD|nr:hypothetical protein [Stigmatella aurantiaca]ADO73113.1 uncharacterized protein STAUR_5342 [Stigmatella aurantiaca DW4/3-1]EAU63829.1 conserved hypothetical protein [Stigmatella aurantiaca DW4/3-1]
MNLRNGLLSVLLFAAACGPESEPVSAEASQEVSPLTQKEEVSPLVSPPVITFWENNGCGGDQVGWYIYNDAAMIMPNASGSGWVNDEARSMMLFRVNAGTIIRVYNSPSGSHTDDWAEITLKRYVDELCIGSFESASPNADYSLRYCDEGGLDGKVSQARAQPYAFTGSSCNGTWRYY